MDIIVGLQKELAKETQLTENGAVGYVTSGKNLLDMNFRVSSYRNMTDAQIFGDFMKAFNEDRIMAIRWLFYVRDVRGGLGERRLFRAVLTQLAAGEPELVKKVLPFIAMFGRWDDLFEFINTSLRNDILNIVGTQLNKDIKDMVANKPTSLLAKWMPSINASSEKNRKLALTLVKAFGVSPAIYRKTLSALRAHLDVVERKMSTNNWEQINYKAVSSRANLIYNPAFLKHDENRRRKFLEKVISGETTINSATNFPHDIVHKYANYRAKDDTLEVLWKALPNYGEGMESTLVVADGSGSMVQNHVGGSMITALSVANSLAIYFAEHCAGAFKNTYVTFSEKPQLVNLGTGSLFSKIDTAQRHCEVANTNIQAVFELILKTAVANKMNQTELPGTVLIISDMEFDTCTGGRGYYSWNSDTKYPSPSKTLFATLADKFANAGYKMPKLAFWNVISRTMTIPVIENEMGVTLVSGFSPAAINMVLCGEADPYKALVKILLDPKYDAVAEAIA